MRTQQTIFTLLAIVTWLTASSAMLDQRAMANGPDPEAGSVRVETSSSSAAVMLNASAVGNCSSTGGTGDSFTAFLNPNYYRGVVFRVDDTTTLREIMIELEFGSIASPLDALISFSVHRAPIGSNSYTPVFVQNPPRTLTGTGRQFYTSGELMAPDGVVLTGGFRYAIGATWNLQQIRFFRDAQVTNLYPQDFPGDAIVPDGVIEGSVGREPISLPIMDDPFFPGQPFNKSAYSMQLCLDPKVGACCDANRPGGCEEVFQDECTAPGSFFHGQKTVCEPGRCQIGACCLRCDDGGGVDADCQDNYVRERCEADLGDWLGSTVSCVAGLCPIVTGACCVPDAVGTGVTTVEMCESDCLAAGGVYQGDGSPLVPSPCHGACCISGQGCSTLSPGGCAVFGGTYRGSGTECVSLPPALECGGACCFGSGGTLNQCNALGTRAECVDAGNIITAYGGDSSTCGGTSCSNLSGLGACCIPDGTCLNTTGPTCVASSMLGVFHATCNDDGVTNCLVDSECPDDIGSCDNKACVGGIRDGLSCTSSLDCIAGDGICVGMCTGGSNDTFACLNDTGCPDIVGVCVGQSCDAPSVSCNTEECCFADGHCEDISANACGLRGATSGGVGTSCSAASCAADRDSCCFNDGSCSVLTELDCNAAGGQYLNDGSDCVIGACSALGSCCQPNHSCSELVTLAECALLGGTFNVNPDCSLATCPGTGGCCTDIATCFTLSQSECSAIAGTYFGDDTVCGQDAICPTGGCCAADGTCSSANQLLCDRIAGQYFGDGSSCSVDVVCATGACCMPDTSCVNLTEFGCNNAGGLYHGDATVCPDDSGRCLVNVCVGGPNDGIACTSDTNCPLGVCPLTSTCFGGDSDGASCQVDNDCRRRLCSFGSCCETDGNCVDGIIELQCDPITKPTATFTLDATCSACPQLGACCFGDESCVQMLESDCTSAGGFFQGELVPCPANGQGGLCTLGACCELDGTCTNNQRQSDCAAIPNSTYNAGQACGQISCLPRGACCVSDGNCVDGLTQMDCDSQSGTAGNYVGDGTLCQPDTCAVGACCSLPMCVGGLEDGSACDMQIGDSDCDNVIGSCVVDVCATGVEKGNPCVDDSECPSSVCILVKSCLDGTDAGNSCVNDSDCIFDEGICTLGDDFCGLSTDVFCRNVNGFPQGASTTCQVGECLLGSCCGADGVCRDGVPMSACDDPIDFRVGVTCSQQVCEARGACCHAGGCDEVTLNACAGAGGLGGTYEGDATTCSPADLCSVGACCMFDGTCAQQNRQDCEDGGGIYAGASLPCDGTVDCTVGSCCLDDGSCLVDTVANICTAMNGTFTVGGDCSNLGVCLQMISSDPANGVVDARIPHERNDAAATFGTKRVVITFNADATTLIATSFDITDDDASVPTITGVDINVGGDPNVIALNFNRNLDLSTWTTITHIDSGSQICLGIQPADVDSNNSVETADISALTTHLTNLDTSGLSAISTDIDRSATQNSLDLIELINVQTGADSFAEWRLASPIGMSPCN